MSNPMVLSGEGGREGLQPSISLIVQIHTAFKTSFIAVLATSLNSDWFLILCTHDQQPQRKGKFPNKPCHRTRVGKYDVAREKEELNWKHEPGKTFNHHNDAQEPGKGARLVNQVTQRKEPGAEKDLGDPREPVLVDIQG
jgi:hypothetical protein